MTYNYKLIIAYDGTLYNGWQTQSNGISIQDVIQKTIIRILSYDVVLIGSGRTDTGVHALGQVAHFHSKAPIDIYRFQNSLNALLPKDIRIIKMHEVPSRFHARHSVLGKTYHYHIQLAEIEIPFNRFYKLHLRKKLDIEKMKEAARQLVGTHDFTSFANQAHVGNAAKNPVRTIKRIDIVEEPGGIRIEFEAKGFLYKMVRNITGTLIAIGNGLMNIDQLPIILKAKDRRSAAKTAPAHGLFLVQVDYPNLESSEIASNEVK